MFCVSSPESKSQLIRNLAGNFEAACRSKNAKIVPIGNPKYCHGRHHENLFCVSTPEPEGQLTQNLVGSIKVTFRSKVAKLVSVGNPRWPPS